MIYDPDKFDPKKHFIRRRNGKVYMFDIAIRNWRRNRKPLGDMKDSIDSRKRDPKKMRNIFG